MTIADLLRAANENVAVGELFLESEQKRSESCICVAKKLVVFFNPTRPSVIRPKKPLPPIPAVPTAKLSREGTKKR
jgi:hypothetical protein